MYIICKMEIISEQMSALSKVESFKDIFFKICAKKAFEAFFKKY